MAGFALRLVALVALGCVVFADEHVLTLTGETFSEAVKSHEKLVVEFYAPWCGHCKSLAPEYEKAAESLKADGIVLAKVDATEEKNKELASKFGVQGFPTLKIFRGSENAEEYQGPRDAPGIIKYCKKAFGPASQELKTEAEVKEAAKSELTVLGVFPKGEKSAEYKTFFEVAEKMRDDATFAHVFSAKLVSDCADCKDATVIVYKDWDEPMTKFKGKITADALKEFVEKTSTPELVSLDRTNKNKKALAKMFADQLPKMLGSAPADYKDIKAFKENLVTITKKYEGKIHVLYMDPKGNEGALNFFGVATDDLPAMFVHEPESNGKFMEKKIKTKDMVKWAEKYSKGELEKVVKSEDIPKKNDDPVFVLVAKQFEEVVTSGKDVFIEFYAPWCGHCKNLAPEWEKLGKKLEAAKNVVIAKMDATANDVPDVKGMKFDVKGFPTLYFVTGADKKVHTYSGQRTFKDLLAFVKKTADPANLEGIDFDADSAEEPAAEAEEEDEYEAPEEADEYEDSEEDKDEL